MTCADKENVIYVLQDMVICEVNEIEIEIFAWNKMVFVLQESVMIEVNV